MQGQTEHTDVYKTVEFSVSRAEATYLGTSGREETPLGTSRRAGRPPVAFAGSDRHLVGSMAFDPCCHLGIARQSREMNSYVLSS